MNIIADCHNDTAYRLIYEKGSLYDNDFAISMKKLGERKALLFFAMFMNYEVYGDNPKEYFLNLYNNLKKELELNSQYITTYTDVNTFLKDSRHSALLTLEGGDFIKSEEDIDFLKSLDIKSIALTWNKSTPLACSCVEEVDTGLTKLGERLLKKMEDEDIIPDFSHSSDKTFFQAMEILKKPALITHSNSREIVNVKRNITDEMFLKLKENGGVCGVNFYSDFAGETVEDLKKHIYHFLSLGGEDNIAFGGDLDGAYPFISPIKTFSDTEIIINSLLKDNINEEIVRKITYKNVLRILGGENGKNN